METTTQPDNKGAVGTEGERDIDREDRTATRETRK